jgi:CMP-N-acetylneuraminic acid synthetase
MEQMKKTIAIIPARGNSKRLEGKNIKMLNGLPLIAYSINYALNNTDYISEVYVSTDNEAIKTIALQYGAKVIDRPASLSGDLEPTVTVLKHALDIINESVDTVVLLQATNPLRPKMLLQDAFEIYKNSNAESLFTVSENNKKLGRIVKDEFIPFNYEIGQRSQDITTLYSENGLLYITKAALIKKDIIFNERSYPLIVNHKFGAVDIDTQDDFDYAEYLLKQKDGK